MANCFCPAISFGGVFTALALLACASTARAGDLPPHPRLLLTPAVEARIRERIEADPLSAMIRDATLVSADACTAREKNHWTTVHNNWSQVCGAGIAIACAAAATDEAALAASPFADCLRIVEVSARFYEPDGGYPEGPSYWDYGTEYHGLGLAVAEGLGRKSAVPKCLLDGAAFMAGRG
jgi:hypothetical protein